jgi:hypothetical protein
MKIYNHDILLSTHEKYGGIHLYSGRALPLTSPEDKVQMHPALKEDWTAISDHYHQVGLTFTDDVIWDVSMAEISRHPDREISVYFFGDAVNANSPYQHLFDDLDADWNRTVAYINSKNNFIQLAQSLNVPVPETLCFESLDDLPALETLPYPCYVKPSVSDHGFGIARCGDSEELRAALSRLEPGSALQVQAEVQASAFLNLQYQVVNGQPQRVLVSEQVLEGCVHGGNRYPTDHEPWEVVEPLAQWLVDRGMKGIFAFDVAVLTGTAEPKYVAIECNPRFNGSSYPTCIAHRLGITAWSSATCSLTPRSVGDLGDLSGLAFNPETGRGLILVNWGTIHAGKLSLLLAGMPPEQEEVLLKFRQRLV